MAARLVFAALCVLGAVSTASVTSRDGSASSQPRGPTTPKPRLNVDASLHHPLRPFHSSFNLAGARQGSTGEQVHVSRPTVVNGGGSGASTLAPYMVSTLEKESTDHDYMDTGTKDTVGFIGSKVTDNVVGVKTEVTKNVSGVIDESVTENVAAIVDNSVTEVVSSPPLSTSRNPSNKEHAATEDAMKKEVFEACVHHSRLPTTMCCDFWTRSPAPECRHRVIPGMAYYNPIMRTWGQDWDPMGYASLICSGYSSLFAEAWCCRVLPAIYKCPHGPHQGQHIAAATTASFSRRNEEGVTIPNNPRGEVNGFTDRNHDNNNHHENGAVTAIHIGNGDEFTSRQPEFPEPRMPNRFPEIPWWSNILSNRMKDAHRESNPSLLPESQAELPNPRLELFPHRDSIADPGAALWNQFMNGMGAPFGRVPGALGGFGGCEKVSPCQCRASDGSFIDLSPLANSNNTPAFKDVEGPEAKQSYSWNPCNSFTEGSDCNDVALCQGVPGASPDHYNLGTQSSAQFQITSDQGLQIKYTGPGDISIGSRQSYVQLVCDENVEREFTVNGEQELGIYYFTLRSRYACPTAPTDPTTTPFVPPPPTSITASPGPGPGPSTGQELKKIVNLLFCLAVTGIVIVIVLLLLLVAILARRSGDSSSASLSKAHKSKFPGTCSTQALPLTATRPPSYSHQQENQQLPEKTPLP